MLGENIIAFDCLETEKHSVEDFTRALLETENQNLRQSLIQIRNQTEQDHQQIYHIAEQNGWYLSASKANPQDVSRVNSFFQQTYQVAQQPQSPVGTYTTGPSQQQVQGPQNQQQYKPTNQYTDY